MREKKALVATRVVWNVSAAKLKKKRKKKKEALVSEVVQHVYIQQRFSCRRELSHSQWRNSPPPPRLITTRCNNKNNNNNNNCYYFLFFKISSKLRTAFPNTSALSAQSSLLVHSLAL